MIARAPRARLASPVSCRTSASLTITHSTSEIAASSESFVVSIQRFIESRALKRASAHWARTWRWRSGWMLARKTTSAPLAASESFGSKSPKTPSWVSSVWATLRSYS